TTFTGDPSLALEGMAGKGLYATLATTRPLIDMALGKLHFEAALRRVLPHDAIVRSNARREPWNDNVAFDVVVMNATEQTYHEVEVLLAEQSSTVFSDRLWGQVTLENTSLESRIRFLPDMISAIAEQSASPEYAGQAASSEHADLAAS
ncbi:hypothetical protein H632_c3959p0, partial [Helicosporidium sp. ATCC 50920]